MRRIALLAFVVTVACACATVGSSPKSRAPVTAGVSNLSMSPQEMRIRVRALIRPTLGIIEESADRILADAKEPRVRRAALLWKIETTTTLLAAMMRNDPVLALADAWGYVLQVQAFLRRPGVAERLGASGTAEKPGASGTAAINALTEIQDRFREFARTLQQDPSSGKFETNVREWADRHPIEGAVYRRPSMDSVFAETLAKSGGGGALAALGALDETTADIMTRMDLYTMYLPRLARWEAELGVDDLVGSADPKTALADFEQLSRAVDRIAVVVESAPAIIARERQAALDVIREKLLDATRDLGVGREAVLGAIRMERIETLRETEAMAERLVARSAGSLREGIYAETDYLVLRVEEMRKRLLVDTDKILAFVRAIELLLIAAVLAGAGIVLYGRYVRRRYPEPPHRVP